MPRQKYEREIDEILERMERQGRLQTSSRPAQRQRWSGLRLPGGGVLRWSNGLWLALSLGLPLLATLLNGAAHGLAAALVLIGLVAFISPLVLRLTGLARPEPTMWRGRVIEMPARGESLAAQWRYRLWAWRQRWERWRRRR